MKTINELYQEIKEHYTDDYGYMDHCKRDPGTGPASGNGRLYTAQAYVLLKRLNLKIPTYKYQSSEAMIPLNQRHPLLEPGTEQHDNLVGLIIMQIAPGYFRKLLKNFPLYKIPDGVRLAPHVAFIINFCANKCWGVINTIWFVIMLLTTPYKKHKEGGPNTGERLMGWTYIQPLIERWPRFGGWVERWYWRKADITECARRYYGDTPWYYLFVHLEYKIFPDDPGVIGDLQYV